MTEISIFDQHEERAEERAAALRERGFEVQIVAFEGGYSVKATGEPAAVRELWQEYMREIEAKRGRRLVGTVRWWKDERGYGRITGDDGYVYFCHFSAVEMEGFRSLRPGQRVEFTVGHVTDHGRLGAAEVRVLDEA